MTNKEQQETSIVKDDTPFMSNLALFFIYTLPILIVVTISADIFRQDYLINGGSFRSQNRFYSNVHPNELFQNLSCDLSNYGNTLAESLKKSSCFNRNNYCGRYFSDFILNDLDSASIDKWDFLRAFTKIQLLI